VSALTNGSPTDVLNWNAANVAMLMWRNEIRTRAALAETLGISRSVINSAFDSGWHGRATTYLIARLTSTFGVLMADIVIEPATIHTSVNNGQKR
jgi:hypothetical protein